MKLKAPPGVGDPCVAGVTVLPRAGIYEVAAEIGAVLIESFGFVEVRTDPAGPPKPAPAPLPKLSLPAWRTKPAAKKP